MNRFRAFFVAFLLAVVAGNSWAEICKGSKVPKAELVKYDKAVAFTPEEESKAKAEHAPWGLPSCPRLLPHPEYIVCYDLEQRVALWVSYSLKRQDIAKLTRRDAFRSSPRLTDEENARCSDYLGSGYDRGHMVPNSDMNRSAISQANTYFLSNMSPQTPNLNRGIWRWLEDRVRAWTLKYDAVHVISGSLFMGETHWLPGNRVGIPRQHYKIVVRKKAGDLKAVAFLFVNWRRHPLPPGTQGVEGRRISSKEADQYLRTRLVSIASIGQATGLDFFKTLPSSQKDALTWEEAEALWPKN